MAAATDRRPAVYLLELDAIGSSSCIKKIGSMPEWEADLRYEMDAMQALPHTVVYVEAGYSDWQLAAYTAKILNRIGVDKIRGFFTNDTHENWTINEVKWAQGLEADARRPRDRRHRRQRPTDPANRDRVKNGNDDLCNPPGRAPRADGHHRHRLSPAPTRSCGPIRPATAAAAGGGGTASGTFWAAYAIGLAERANQQLGPGLPAMPY
jgi:endoglucanase